MKKLITTLMIALIVSAGMAQTTRTTSAPIEKRNVLASKDTERIITTSVTTTTIVRDTLKYKPPIYRSVGPLVLQSGNTYKYLTIDVGKANITALSGNGVSNIHITHCRILNTISFAVNLNNCANILIDSCYFSNVGAGVYAQNKSTGIKVNSNQFLNINGISATSFGHAIQFNGVFGGGNQMNYNRIENIAGVAIHPHDILNVYHSSGIPGDSIQVIGNWIRGGQLSYWPTANAGACGIVLGDEYGSYQVARGNILVNPGAGGVAIIGNHGGGVGLKADHNLIYSVQTPVTGQAIGVQIPNVTDVGYNKVNWTNSTGGNAINSSPYSQFWLSNSPIPLNWNTNVWVDTKEITPAILPTTIITMK